MTKITFKQLQEKLLNWEKYPGCEKFPSGPMINEGFPTNFNLSFSWYEWIEENKGVSGDKIQYIDFNKDLVYSKTQPCIRPQDWKKLIDNQENKYRYLSYFHMTDVSGFMTATGKEKREEFAKFSIKSLLDFFKDQGLDLSKVYVSYLAGGEVSELTAGKYNFDFYVPEDPFLEEWIKNGVPRENMMPDKSRNTLLALKNYSRPTPWGYRNEIHYKHNGKLLDIATIEHITFKPLFDSDMNIVGLTDYQNSISASVVGVERLLMVLNDYKDIREVDIIQPIYDLLYTKVEAMSEYDADMIVQALRPVHAIVADGGHWSALNKRRREIIRSFYMEFADAWSRNNLNIHDPLLRELLELNAELLGYEKLQNSIDDTIEEIKSRIEIMSKNKHLPTEVRERYKVIFTNEFMGGDYA